MKQKKPYLLFIALLNLLFLSASFNANSQTVRVVSNSQGYVTYESTFLPSNLHFYLTGDGFYKREISPSHQFEESALGYDTEYYTIGDKELNEPPARVIKTGGTETPPSGGYNNPPIPMSPNIDLETSWNITNYTQSFVMLKFENEFQSTTSSGCIEFQFDPNEIEVMASKIKIYNSWATNQIVQPNKIKWDYSNLAPGEQRVLYIPVTAIIEEDTPITMSAFLFNECTGAPLQNEFTTSVSRYPHDPNYKKSINLTELSESDALESEYGTHEQFIIYEVQFHNDGDAYAENVSVEDILPEGVDESSIEVITSDHDVEVSGSTFIFNSINLPGLGMGYSFPETISKFTFKVCLESQIYTGDCRINTVDIYFDNQPPVSASNELCCENEIHFDNPCNVIGSVKNRISKGFETNENIIIAPNPANDYIELFNIDVNNIISMEIVSASGISHTLKNKQRIDVNTLSSGVYFLHIETNESSHIKKFIKL